MRIQHNIMAMNAYRNYTSNVSAMKSNLEKLSSGYKINRAGDDAAGLAISEKMRAQITGLQTAQKNAKSGINLVQTAEGAMTEVHDMLNRMVELATQSANGTYDNTTDRNQMQKEVKQLLEEIDRIADSANFNGIKLLDGTLGLNTDTFQVGDSTAFVAKAADTTWKPSTADINSVHGGTSTPGVAPSFKVDLSHLTGKASWATVASSANTDAVGIAAVTIKLNVGGTDLTGKLAASAARNTARAGGSANATAIANAFATNSVAIGGLNFKIEASQGVLTFTATKAGADIIAADVTKFKAIAGGNVTMTDGVGLKTAYSAAQELNYNHAPEDITDAKANAAGGRLGMDIDISGLLKDGNKLTIDGKEFTFHIGSTATTANTASKTDIYINTKNFATAGAQLREALVILSNKDTTNFDIEAKNNKLHIDAKNNTVTKTAMLDGIKGTVVGNPARAANTKLIMTGTAKEGNVLTIGTDKVELKNGDDADAVAAAIRAKGYTVTVADGVGTQVGKKVLTVNAKTTAASVGAPQILGKGLTLQIGDTSDDFNQLNVSVQDMHAKSLGIKDLNISTEEAAQKAIQKIKDAINTVSDVRGTLGATQNRLDHTINNLSVMTENIQDAESTIRDTDVAEEMMAYTKNNILIQSAQAMLAQANQVPQGVLQLLG